MRIIDDFINLFYPKLCLNCEEELVKLEELLCLNCLYDLPLLNIDNEYDNDIIRKFYGRVPLKSASAYLEYRRYNITQKLIHDLKYKGSEHIGDYLGFLYANYIKEQQLFKDVDYIVPVPLSDKKLRQRGYNQVTKFGEVLSCVLNIAYAPNILLRNHSSETQTHKTRVERFENIKEQFVLSDVHYFENKHVLLIDDVITTGATIEVCCNELLKTKAIEISILAIANTSLA